MFGNGARIGTMASITKIHLKKIRKVHLLEFIACGGALRSLLLRAMPVVRIASGSFPIIASSISVFVWLCLPLDSELWGVKDLSGFQKPERSGAARIGARGKPERVGG